MRVLLIHTYYHQRGGEDIVFEQETALLNQDHDVETLTFRNRIGWKGLFQFIFSIWNLSAAKRVHKKIKFFQPDVVHIHNTHFACGPLVIREIKRHKIPIVMTLHNYRLICPSGSLLANRKLFLASTMQRFPWTAIIRTVYRNSFFLTFWLAFITWFHHAIHTFNKVDRFICLTQSSLNLFKNAQIHIPTNRFTIKPNFTSPPLNPVRTDSGYFLFIGRISVEKGIEMLLNVFAETTFPIKIIGDGPLSSEVKKHEEENPNIHFIGRLPKNEVDDYLAACTALVFPSTCYESFGLAIIEAFSFGKPAIASNIGAPSELVNDKINGFLFEPNNQQSLKSALTSWILLSEQEKRKIGVNARKSYETYFTPAQNMKELSNLYNEVIKDSKQLNWPHEL